MNFFCTKEHYDEWTTTRNIDKETIFELDTEKALMVAEYIFKLD
ncbi:alkylmercury lyase family protein [Desulfopila sp. IMCC35008]|nr:alkylmercury lyase family protein [Desulfopila sp. IMCC35008]